MAKAAATSRIIVLFACLWLTVRATPANCGEECALCLLRLQDKPLEMDAVTCTLECEGRLATAKSLDLCRDLLQGDKAEMMIEGQVTMATPNQEEEDNQMAKKYSGFIKRYGGFMKKADEGVVDRLNILKELLNPKVEDKEEIGERYGGFTQTSKHISAPDEEVKELKKRYGGFMRRVGRPTWKEDEKRYVGFLQAPQGEAGGADLASMKKQYGRFND